MNDRPTGGGGHDPQHFHAMGDHWSYSVISTYVEPTSLRVSDAIIYGWNKFRANMGTWIAFMALFGVVGFVAYVAIFSAVFLHIAASGALEDPTYDAGDGGLSIGLIAGTSLTGILMYFGTAVLTRGALLELDGRRPTFGSFWRLPNVANVAVFAVVSSIVNAVLGGAVEPWASVLVGIVWGIVVWFAVHFLLDRGLSAPRALAANLRLVASNPGPLALFILTLSALNVAGALLCLLGLIITVPVTMIATAYTFRVLAGGPVSVAP